jgi:hypothetical protein
VVDNIRRYVIQDLGDAASTQTFEWNKKNKEFEFITVENYYLKHYGLPLKLVY